MSNLVSSLIVVGIAIILIASMLLGIWWAFSSAPPTRPRPKYNKILFITVLIDDVGMKEIHYQEKIEFLNFFSPAELIEQREWIEKNKFRVLPYNQFERYKKLEVHND